MLALSGSEPKPREERTTYWTRAQLVVMNNRALAKMTACHPDLAPQYIKDAMVRYYTESTRPGFVSEKADQLLYALFETLPKLIAEEAPELITEIPGELAQAKRIRRSVCERHTITEREIRSESRYHRYCKARHEAFYLMARDTSLSWVRIARLLGRDDHTTAMRGARSHARDNGLPEPRTAAT